MKKINLVRINKYDGHWVWIFEDTMQTLQYMLLLAGYQCQITTNFVDPDPSTVNVLFGVGTDYSHSFAEVASVAEPRNVIIFNGEQLGSSSLLITSEYLEFLSRYVIFDWCEGNLRDINHRIKLRAFEIPLFPSASLCQSTETHYQIQYDVAFYGSLNHRRKLYVREMEEAGVRIKFISNAYGAALTNQLLDCRYVVNMHAYETDNLELNRCLRPLAIGIPIISEASTVPSIGNWEDSGILFVPTEGFGQAVKAIIDGPPEVHMVASRKAVQFTNRPANVGYVRQAMERGIAALAIINSPS